MSAVDREAFKAAARAAAWPEHAKCEACDGTGESKTVARHLVHSVGGGFGADWNLEQVLEAIDSAAEVAWVDGFVGHNLAVRLPDGHAYAFQVPHPCSLTAEECCDGSRCEGCPNADTPC